MTDSTQVKAEVWRTVQAMNRVWTVDGDPDKLREYFHADMVAITPVDRERRLGREACVEGWKQFVETTRIHFWKELDPDIRLFNDGRCAIVTYYFDMSFDMNGRTVPSSGRDMYTLINENGRWWIVADQFSPYPSS